MAVGAFLRRELLVSVRRRAAFAERCTLVVLAAILVAACAVAWDWWGWDRSSVIGASSFALAAFGLIVSAQVVFLSGFIATVMAPAIASERDRKSLDALLATRASAAEIVLGALGAGMLRYANLLLPLVPLLVLFRAVDLRLILLAAAGVLSTACVLAAASVAVSAVARTATRASSIMVLLTVTWMCGPIWLVLIMPRLWPAAASWIVPALLTLLDSSPTSIGLSLVGAVPRGPLASSVLRMIAYQSAASVVLVLWAMARLRPASRALYDLEGRTAFRRLLRARWRPRPACGDDPVLWREIYPGRSSPVLLLAGYVINVIWIGLFGYVISWFAVPAFAELFRNGYGAGNPSIPEIQPLARMVVARLTRLPMILAPGQARLEFNVVQRQATAVIDFIYVILVAGFAAESIVLERERDTWPGLIATPLTGRDILLAKMIGTIWKARILGFLLLALWTVGLAAGSVHPLGFLAAIAGLGVSSWFLAALGIYASLWGRDRNQATGWALVPLMLSMGLSLLPFTKPGLASVLLADVTMPFQLWAAILSYEDIHALLRARVSPQIAAIGIPDIAGARIAVALWLAGTTAQGVGAFLLTRSACRGFDVAVGRPARP